MAQQIRILQYRCRCVADLVQEFTDILLTVLERISSLNSQTHRHWSEG